MDDDDVNAAMALRACVTGPLLTFNFFLCVCALPCVSTAVMMMIRQTFDECTVYICTACTAHLL